MKSMIRPVSIRMSAVAHQENRNVRVASLLSCLAFGFCLAFGAAMPVVAAEYAIWTGAGDGASWSDAANWYRRTSDKSVYAMATNASAVVLDSEFTADTVWFNTADHALTGPIRLSGGQLKVLQILSFGSNPMGGGEFCRTTGNIAHYFRSSQNAKILAEGIAIIGGDESASMDYFEVGTTEYTLYGTSAQCEYTQTGGQFRVWTKTFRVGGIGNTMGNGTLDLAAVDHGVLKAFRTVSIGSYRGTCRGTVALGRDWTVGFGTAEAPLPFMDVGYTSYQDGVAEGNFSMTGGSFELYATNLNVAAGSAARSSHYAGIAIDGATHVTVFVPGTFSLSWHGRSNNETINTRGLFDAGNCSNIVFNVGKLVLGVSASTGSGVTGNGHLRLGRGQGVIGDLVTGTQAATGKVRGVLELNGMELGVTNYLNCGVSGIISNTVSGISSGLALIDACANCATNVYAAPMHVRFSADPEPSNSREKVTASSVEMANDWYWGFKWEGDRVAEMEALMAGSNPKLAVDASGLSAPFAQRCGVHYSAADHTTYLGIPLWRRPLEGFMMILR